MNLDKNTLPLNCTFTCISNLKHHNAQTRSAWIKCKITISNSKPYTAEYKYCSIKWLFYMLIKTSNPVDSSFTF